MTKEEIIKYVTSSPENTNPNVLEGMLEELDSGGGDYKKELLVDTQIIAWVPPSGTTPGYNKFSVPSELNLNYFDIVIFTLYIDNQFYNLTANAIITEYNTVIENNFATIIIDNGSTEGKLYLDDNEYSGNIQIYKLIPTSSSSNNSNDTSSTDPLNPINNEPEMAQ